MNGCTLIPLYGGKVYTGHQLANSTINIYPNPVVNDINIIVSGQLDYSVSFYTLGGKLIKKSKNEKVMSVKSIPSGTYLLEVKDLNTGQKIVERVVVRE